MKRIAILGAGGFVGSRIVEMSVLRREFDVVPIIRSPKSACRLARLGQIWQFAGAGDAQKLGPLMAGCDAVVNVTVGDYEAISETTEAFWRACAAAKVPRFIHISTGSVFGRVEDPNTSDDSPLVQNHWMPYVRAKVAAEEVLKRHFADGRVGCTILRPYLIWGVRSPWVEGPAADMMAGKAFLIGGGKGVCNLINVDNLIQEILALVDHEPVSGCFNVSDDESTSWAAYYAALAQEIGIDFKTINQLSAGPYRPTLAGRITDFKQSGAWQWLKTKLSRPARLKLRAMQTSFQPTSGPEPAPQPVVTRGGWENQNVVHKLSNAKFRRTFGRKNELTFVEAMTRVGDWLRASGFGRC
jgi:2-alkyl-3-oxoalkanoate reductase